MAPKINIKFKVANDILRSKPSRKLTRSWMLTRRVLPYIEIKT